MRNWFEKARHLRVACLALAFFSCKNGGKLPVEVTVEHRASAADAERDDLELSVEEYCSSVEHPGMAIGLAQLIVDRGGTDAGQKRKELWHIYCSGAHRDVLACRVTQIDLDHLQARQIGASDIFADSYSAELTDPDGYRLSFAKMDFKRGLRLVDGSFVACPPGPNETKRVTKLTLSPKGLDERGTAGR